MTLTFVSLSSSQVLSEWRQDRRMRCARIGQTTFTHTHTHSHSNSFFSPRLRAARITHSREETSGYRDQWGNTPGEFLCSASTGDDAGGEGGKTREVKREYSPEVKELRSVLKKCSLYLVGPMGSGKSAVGKFLAHELGFHFLDTDSLIEGVAKKSVADLFSDDGEYEFRDVEAKVLEQVSAFIGCVVATGGGIVLRKNNWGHLQTGIVIYLNTKVDLLYHRLSQNGSKETQHRPLLTSASSPDQLRERIENIVNERDHLYRQADVVIDIGDHNYAVDDVAKELVRKLTNFIKANPPKLSKLYPGGEQFS